MLARARVIIDNDFAGDPDRDDIADLAPVRVLTTIDMRLMYADLVAKLAAHAIRAHDPEHRSPRTR